MDFDKIDRFTEEAISKLEQGEPFAEVKEALQQAALNEEEYASVMREVNDFEFERMKGGVRKGKGVHFIIMGIALIIGGAAVAYYVFTTPLKFPVNIVWYILAYGPMVGGYVALRRGLDLYRHSVKPEPAPMIKRRIKRRL